MMICRTRSRGPISSRTSSLSPIKDDRQHLQQPPHSHYHDHSDWSKYQPILLLNDTKLTRNVREMDTIDLIVRHLLAVQRVPLAQIGFTHILHPVQTTQNINSDNVLATKERNKRLSRFINPRTSASSARNSCP